MDYRANVDKIQFSDGPNARFNSIYDINFVDVDPPPAEPVTLAEALAHCLIDNLGQDNSIVEAFITTARQMCEIYTGIGFINRDIVCTLNNSLGGIYLPYGPIVDVISVKDYDGNTVSNIKLIGVRYKQLAEPNYSFLEVEYNAGFTELPQLFKTALLAQVAYLYEHRGDEKEGTLSPVMKSILNPHRRVSS